MSNPEPAPESRPAIVLTPTIEEETSAPGRALPSGAAEPIRPQERKFSQHTSNNSAHSLLYRQPPAIDLVTQRSQLTASPTQLSQQASQQYIRHSNASRPEVFGHILRKTCGWVIAGIIIMIVGIGLLRGVVLPHIFTCPENATCSGNFDPNTGNTLQLLQTFTSYWIKVGLIVSSVGILRLASYQAWFILMHKGNSVRNLDLNLGAIRGSINDSAILLFKENNRLLSLFVFALLGISAAINLIVGLSIDPAPGTRSVFFSFEGTSVLPSSSTKELNTDGELLATQKIITWALHNDQTHDGALKGTLVTPDARSTQAVNALPAGPTINAWFECEGWNNFTVVPKDVGNGWYIWVNGTQFIALPSFSLGVSEYHIDTAFTQYLWVSNTTGLIPNATQSADGGMNAALCTHYYEMVPQAPTQLGFQYLTPTVPILSGCDSQDTNVCISDSVNKAILNWWGGLGSAFWIVSCRGGLLGPTRPTSQEELLCPITQELFQATASGMLDAIIQTAPTSVQAGQELVANVMGLNGRRWWLNVTIPAATVIIYLIGLGYTAALSQGDVMLKELNLEEVVRAAQTDHVHDLVSTGTLKETPLRYHSDVGFVDGNRLRWQMNSTQQ